MSKLKLNIIDITIISVLIIAILGGGFYYVSKHKPKNIAKNETKIEFDIEIPDISMEAAKSYVIGAPVIYGMTNIDRGTITNVKIEPYKKMTRDTENGVYFWKSSTSSYQATITIAANVTETNDNFKGEKEEIRTGMQMQFHGKGFASDEGYIVGLRN